MLADFVDQPEKLLIAEEGRRAAAEIDEFELPAGKGLSIRVEGDFFCQRIRVDIDLVSILVGIDAEIAEGAALAAERDMQVETKRRFLPDGRIQNRVSCRDVLRSPGRERRGVGDEVAADLGRFRLLKLGQLHGVWKTLARPTIE